MISPPTDAYATLEDVKQLLPHRSYDSKSKPSADEAEAIIIRIGKIINGRLRALGLSPPLTDADDVELLAHVNALGAAALIEAATLGTVQGDSPMIVTLQDAYTAELDAISKGKYQFKGAGVAPAQTADGNDDLDAGGSREEPVFKISSESRKNQF